jgi:transposase
MEYIKGEGRQQTLLMPECIEDYIDAENPVRVIDAFVSSLDLIGLGFVRAELKDKTGRPPYDPKDMLKLYVYGYLNRIRSSRRLETESRRNLEVIWLLQKLSPDHKTIARFRQDNSKALKGVFKEFVGLCVRLDLYGKELETLDGSKFKAVNSRSHNLTRKQIEGKIVKIGEKIDEYLAELDHNDEEESTCAGEKAPMEIKRIVTELAACKERYEGYARELEETKETQKSLTDPESRLMPTGGKMDVCYNVQTVVDAKHKLIVNYDVSNQGNDKNFITPLMTGAQEILGTEQITAVMDAGYESIQDILTARSRGIEAHVAGTDFDICVPADKGGQAQIQSHHNGRCVYIAERNIALCPMGNVLYPAAHSRRKLKGDIAVFRNNAACGQCARKCTKEAHGRFKFQIPMSKEKFSKSYNDQDLIIKQIRINADKNMVKRRKEIAEHPFGTIKRGMEAWYCLTKGLRKVRGEFALTFLAYNMKRVINILGCAKLIAAMA